VANDTSVDQVLATSIAATIAESADMPISNNVSNLSQSLAIESTLAQTDTNVISKPQIIQPAADSRSSKKYTAVAGDSVPTVSQKFGISATTIKWANKLTTDTLEPGKVLTIPPVDGVIYTVRAGDTVDSIASKYKADRDRLVAFNDLELSGNPSAGAQIIIPGGDLPTTERPGYVAPVAYSSYTSYGGGGGGWTAGASGGNRYAWGNCTWYAYERRLQLGMPIGGMWGNANTWAYAAAASGFAVDGNPTPGAVMQNGGGYGHVAIVESVNPGVSISISEMNGYRFGGGFNRVGRGDISWGEAVSGMYRYIH
jgi:surface antigen/LysM repeat protein